MDIDAAVAAKQSNVVAITLAAQPFICSPCPPSLSASSSAHLCSLQTYKQPQWQPPVLLLLHLTASTGGKGRGTGEGVLCVYVDCEDVLPGINLHLMLNKAALHVQARRKKNV